MQPLTFEQQEQAVVTAEAQLRSIVREHFPNDEDGAPQVNRKFRHFVGSMIQSLRDTPASAMDKYHSAWPGGLLVHTVAVINYSLVIATALDVEFCTVDNSADRYRSLIRVAFLHDLGKLGNVRVPYYERQTNDWRRENLGENYTINFENLVYLPVTLRSVWLATQWGVTLTEEEFQAVVSSDGPESRVGREIPTVAERPLAMILQFADKWAAIARRT